MARATLALLLTLAAAACRDAPAASPPRVAPRCAYAAACPAMTPARSLDDSPEWRAIAPRLDAPTVDDLLEIELQVAHAVDPTLDLPAARARVDAMVAAVRRTLPRRCDARCRVRALNRHLFEARGFTAVSDPDRLYDDVRNDLLPHVIERESGYCVGLSHLYLTLALRLGLDATVVPLRLHEFVRVTDERGAALDIDPTRNGDAPVVGAACAGAAPVFGRGLSRRAIAARTVALAGLAPGFAALGWLDAAVRLDDTDPDLFNNRGMHRLRWGDPAGALADLRRASALDPCTAVYGVNEAGVLWSTGHPAEARARLDAVTRTSGPGMVVEVRRALMAYDDGRDAEADATFTAALERWAGAPSILQARAAVRLGQGRAADALRDVQAALAVDDAAESYANVVLAAIEAGDVAAAEEALVGLAARSPVAGSVDLHRALVAAARGRYGAAEEAARRCLARYGRRCVRGMLVLADAARARGDEGCARRYAEAYLSCPRAPGDRRQRQFDERTRERYLR